ncbi:DUF6912 family protein [Kineococcus terrestris]|uniref:DUF6912 family protein n=1 Tax=Kineococcus terrestris TaxID=2044856 RepID=UPI0034DB32B7
MRVYWPTTLAELARVVPTGTLAPAPVPVHAVTPALRDWYADADPRDLEEELEYVALGDAAERSLRALAAEGGRRRVVVALDVPETAAAADRGSWTDAQRSRVDLQVPLELGQVVSVHVDDAEAEPDVAAALAALAAADAGDEAARERVEDVEGHELLWYDATELPLLLALG